MYKESVILHNIACLEKQIQNLKQCICDLQNDLYTAGYGINITEDKVISAIFEDGYPLYDLRYLPEGLIEPGYVTWSGTDLDFDVTHATYRIGHTIYNSPASTVTLNIGDPDFGRFDMIAVDINENVVVVEGIPSSDPVVPQVDDVTQVALTPIFVAASATTPVNISVVVIYDENLEFDVTSSVDLTIDPDNQTNVFHYQKSIDVDAWSDNEEIDFTSGDTFDITDFSVIKLFIKLKAPVLDGDIRVSFLSGGTPITDVIPLLPQYGFDEDSLTYQNITIPISDFNIITNTFNRVRISHINSGSGYYMDYVQLQTGIINPNPSITTFLGLEDTPDSYSGQAGKVVVVKDTEDGLEFIDGSGFGLVIGYEGAKTEIVSDVLEITTEFTSELPPDLVTVQVGGLAPTTIDALTGESLRKIIEDMVAPTLNPTLVPPSNGFTRTSPSGTLFETGSIIDIDFTATFDLGSITPQYSAASPFRSGLPTNYNYTGTGLPTDVPSAESTDDETVDDYTVLNGTNTWTSSVDYSIGVQPYNNKGGTYSTPLPAGTTGFVSSTLTGIYPVFVYKSSSPISAAGMVAAIEAGNATKFIIISAGTISIPYAPNAEYIAVAYPSTSTTKTIWYVNALDNGLIPGGVFNAASTQSIDSPDGFWTNINFKVHVTPLITNPTAPTIELRNS